MKLLKWSFKKIFYLLFLIFVLLFFLFEKYNSWNLYNQADEKIKLKKFTEAKLILDKSSSKKTKELKKEIELLEQEEFLDFIIENLTELEYDNLVNGKFYKAFFNNRSLNWELSNRIEDTLKEEIIKLRQEETK